MQSFDLVIRGGPIVTACDNFVADVAVAHGRCVAIGADLEPGAQKVDATGLQVMPGGIDVHTHLDAPLGEVTAIDDFESGTAAAACGGIFADSRPALAEAEATARAIAYAELVGAEIYIVHLSTRGALDAVRAAGACGVALTAPVLETATHWYTHGFDPTLDGAMRMAARQMLTFIVRRYGLTSVEAYSLMSVAVDFGVTQVVDQHQGIHAGLPKAIFARYATIANTGEESDA